MFVPAAATAFSLSMNRRFSAVAAALLFIALLLAYGFDLGHGFVKDDFNWIYTSPLRSAVDVVALMGRSSGFYRPLVSISFGVDQLLFDLRPAGYGWTNFVLLVACGGSIASLVRTMGMPLWAGLVAAAVWAFNFHGINMAVLWLSARTGLLFTLFAALTLRSVLVDRWLLAGGLCFAALCSKEEAVCLPLLSAVWVMASISGDRGVKARMLATARATWPQWVALGIYLLLRAQSGAFTPRSAPSFYQFTFDPGAVLRNVGEYADRSSTFAAAVTLLALVYFRTAPRRSPEVLRWILQGSSWLALGFAITVWLPVRSSLYAVMPSVGSAIIPSALLVSAASSVPVTRVRRAALAGLVLPFLLLPIYRARNVRWVELADLSAYTLRFLDHERATLPAGSLVTLIDDPATRANLASAFGSSYPQAARLAFGDRLQLWIELPPDQLAESGLQRPAMQPSRIYELARGVLREVPFSIQNDSAPPPSAPR